MSTAAQARLPVRVGVLLAPPPQDLGEWLADAAAFDAAGADALWIDGSTDAWFDPLVVTAALAPLTFRSLLVTVLPEPTGDPWAEARALATLLRLSRGRLGICGEPAPPGGVALAGHGRSGMVLFDRLDDDAFMRTTPSGEPERWERTSAPAGRAAWRAAVDAAAERRVGGLLVPAAPQLLDILRNPGAQGDRSDLQIAQG